MSDVHDQATRSYNTSRIKGRDTEPERIVRAILTKHKFRYRLNVKRLPGKPDIVLGKLKVVILVHGCFWHGHAGCKYFKIPQSRREWWIEKINRTKDRDQKNVTILESMGWKVIEIWECELSPSEISGHSRSLIKNLIQRSGHE